MANKPLPLEYPLDPIKYPPKTSAHDPNKDLFNPVAKFDWKPGDIVWFYQPKPRLTRMAIVTDIYGNPRYPTSLSAFCRTIDGENNAICCAPKELFPSRDALLAEFFCIDESVNVPTNEDGT